RIRLILFDGTEANRRTDWRLGSQKMIKRCAERIEIAALMGALDQNLSERRIDTRVPRQAPVSVDSRHLSNGAFRESEVEQEDLSTRGHLQVCRLDVTVKDRRFLRVQVLEKLQQLDGPVEHRNLSQWT